MIGCCWAKVAGESVRDLIVLVTLLNNLVTLIYIHYVIALFLASETFLLRVDC